LVKSDLENLIFDLESCFSIQGIMGNFAVNASTSYIYLRLK